MKSKKVLSAMLVIAVTVSLSAGCGSDPGSSGSSASVESTASGGSSTVSSTVQTTHKFKAMVQEQTLANFRFADRDKYIAFQELENIFKEKGLEIEYDIVQRDQYLTTLTTSLASNDVADYVGIQKLDLAGRLACIKNGTFIPIDDMIANGDGTAKKFYEAHPEIKNKTDYIDGKLYWIPEYGNTTYKGKELNMGSTLGVLIRQDWLDAMNMAMPKTLDEFTAYLQGCQDNDLNDNGMKDEFYSMTMIDFTLGIGQWFGVPQDYYGLNLGDGKAYCSWERPGVKQYFKYILDLLDKGLLSKDYIANEDPGEDAKFNNQLSGLSDYFVNGWSEAEMVVQDGAPPASLIGVPPIQAVEGVEPFASADPAVGIDIRAYAFTKSLKDPEAGSIFLDIMYSDEYSLLSNWGIKGVTYEEKDGMKYFIGDATDDKWDQAAISGISCGRYLWAFTVFPNRNTGLVETDLMGLSEEKAALPIALAEADKKTFVTLPNSCMAIPVEEEASVLEKYEASFISLSKEIGSSIYKKEINIDTDWDSKVIAPLKAAGMDELIAVYQARLDRYLGK